MQYIKKNLPVVQVFNGNFSSYLLLYYRQIPRLKQRIAGKSIPIEKFAVRKAERYHEQQGMLVLPAIVRILNVISA